MKANKMRDFLRIYQASAKSVRVIFALALIGTLNACTTMPGIAPWGVAKLTGPLLIEKQGSFFVSGRNIKSDTLSTLPAYAASGTVAIEQMYVRYQIPVAPQRPSLTLIHGCCLTGKTWESTPDGRMGWDEYFVRQGYPVYVIDQVSRGRSAANATQITSVRAGKTPAGETPPVFMAGQEAAWAIFRFGPEYPKVYPGMMFPLEAQEEFWKQMVPDWIATLPTPNPTVSALSELAIKLQSTVLISHSQSGIYPFQVVAKSPQGVAGIVSIEPGACPSASADLTAYLKTPILVLWGDYVDLSPRWSPRLKGCREFAQAVTKAGGRAENVVLPEVGMKGGSHMLMQDRNSHEVAAWLAAWIDKNIK
jgi:pimeloyl-ACP methyl ester carboxylesterase